MAAVSPQRTTGKPYWELHVTIATQDLPGIIKWQDAGIPCLERLRRAITDLGWVYSTLTDDIILGPGAKAYATTHVNVRRDLAYCTEKVQDMGLTLRRMGYHVLREKVELVQVDIRYP